MKLTKSRLNEIIKEEVSLAAIRESAEFGEVITTPKEAYDHLESARLKVAEIHKGTAPPDGQSMSQFAFDILVIITRVQAAINPDPPPEGP